MTTIPNPYLTGYVGAHRWTITERQGWDWTCCCGDHGRVVGCGITGVLETFARHAHDSLEKAAIKVALDDTPRDLAVDMYLKGEQSRNNDERNLWILLGNEIEYRRENPAAYSS
jgi:hypothetical protein